MKQSIAKFSSGFTIIEVLMAVTVLSVGIVGTVGVITYNMSIAASSINKIVAANLAQDGIESVRALRDSNWREGKTGNNWDDGFTGTASPDNPRANKFFCGDGSSVDITPKPNGAANQSRIDDCGAACQVYAYSLGSNKCYGGDFGNPYGGYSRGQAAINGVAFYRLINIRKINNDSNRVISIIKWIERGQSRYFTAEEVLYNWR